MAERHYALRLRTAQYIYDMAGTETLADSVHAGKRLLRIFGGIKALRRREAYIAIPTILVKVLAEIQQQYPSPTEVVGVSETAWR